ncbi:gon7 family protein [Teratosphaeria destructans]|uniref:EKC/KEOPS complex subunit GON7 n=1 Tax=Teratosphaeria destructans TaxID=418781 RepID=A0A9W7SVQ5_9PEZI|nr:gon7 family protein [Teratosphaeria destructans]
MAANILLAAYRSPTDSKTFSADLPDSQGQDVKAKTGYLAALRSSASQMQADINAYLTQKMEDEKATGQGPGVKSVGKDDKLEEMYGEEDPEQEG